jgi:hypothetical protein
MPVIDASSFLKMKKIQVTSASNCTLDPRKTKLPLTYSSYDPNLKQVNCTADTCTLSYCPSIFKTNTWYKPYGHSVAGSVNGIPLLK